MKYIKKEELIEGEIYKHDNGNIVQYHFLNENDKVCGKFIRVPNHFQSDLRDHPGRFTISNLKLATPEEKHWLNTCIKLDKFITYNEAMKTFIPEYVECIESKSNSYKLNKIYKVQNDNYVNSETGLWTAKWNNNSNHQSKFKPSTKEAYDAQFVVKEPEFVLPEKWCIKVTNENRDILNNFRKQYSDTPILYKYLISLKALGHNDVWNTEITLDQFKKYVLKEEIIEEKGIELLPQFKVIESIETITKVENNEGNQFFIGDIVKSVSGMVQKIESFQYNRDKTHILAFTDYRSLTGISINKLEHYIEPKVEFILPEKWCVKNTNSLIGNYFNNKLKTTCYTLKGHRNCYLHSLNFYNEELTSSSIRSFSNESIRNGFTEITLEEFKKHVLKEDEPIIIAESIKDMLDLKSKGVDSIVLPNETLLDKAKRLYPIRTIVKSVCFNVKEIIKTDVFKETIHTDTGKVIYADDGHTSIYLEQKDKWAEVIEYPHGFKVGDKIRSKYSYTQYQIIKIEGNQLFFETDDLPKINSILAKNAIKIN